MRPDLLKYIKELSTADRKNLSQKVLKLMEEAGELAKAALPYDHAFATNHRFVTPEKILEEAVDSILVALSIPYTLGFDDEDIANMMKKKADFWAELQARDARINDKTPYELHVTVEQAGSLEDFRRVCAALEVKPIVLDLHTRDDGVIKDVMTSSVFFGRNAEALAQLERVSAGLQEAGLKVVRKKIETVPWHPAAPSRMHANPMMPKDCYFECHFAVKTLDDRPHMDQLAALAKELKCHLSKNVFKRHEEGKVTVMMTYRTYTGVYEDVKERVQYIARQLKGEGFGVDKELIEFSLYDTKVHHDTEWLKAA